MDLEWTATGAYANGRRVIMFDKKYRRPTEVDRLLGDSAEARKFLKWEPKYDLNSLVTEMVKADYKAITEAK
jgi:GDPmannose 4,6-dehydratase